MTRSTTLFIDSFPLRSAAVMSIAVWCCGWDDALVDGDDEPAADPTVVELPFPVKLLLESSLSKTVESS